MKLIKETVGRIWKDIKGGWIAIALILVYGLITTILFERVCPFCILTGLPCPGCGMTRSLISIITFRFSEAWVMHPFGFLVLPYLILGCVWRYVLDRKLEKLLIPGVLIGCGMIAFYIYRMIAVFPGPDPMNYHTPNIIDTIVHLC